MNQVTQSNQSFDGLRKSILAYDKETASNTAKEIINRNLDALQAIEEGVSRGLEEVGKKFERMEVFLPELMQAADAAETAISILKTQVPSGKGPNRGRVVIGTVQGDIHDLGKNIVKACLIGAGFEVQDLGVNVPSELFIEKALEFRADIIALSCLMTTSLSFLRIVIDWLETEQLRPQFKVMVGGAPVSEQFANEIGADAYGRNASEAIQMAKKLVKK